MDVVVPLNNGSRYDDLELRYCLRGLEKHIKGMGEIYIVGEKPEWLRNVNFLPMGENNNNWHRAQNIFKKLSLACQHIDGDFLYVNDDHFVLKDFRIFPNLHRGMINLSSFTGNQPQYKQMQNTLYLMKHNGFDYDVHCPMVLNSHTFKETFFNLPWPEYGYGIKSLYGNYNNVIGSFSEDLKFHDINTKEEIYQALEGREWFSTGDRCFRGAMKEVLAELYPGKSSYE